MAWVSFSVDAHPKKQTKYKQTFAFERLGAGIVEKRGHGPKVISNFTFDNVGSRNLSY